jgi:hypothetical protein
MDDVDPQTAPRDAEEWHGIAPQADGAEQDTETLVDPGLDAGDGQGPHELELKREALTMALYLSLSLLAVLVTLPEVINPEDDNRWEATGTVFVTAVGLLLAHHLAFRLSSRLVSEGLLTAESRLALKAQLYGGVPVVLIATVPVLIFGEEDGEAAAIVALLAFVTWAAYRSARKRTSRLRSWLYVGVVLGAAFLVLAVKTAVSH